MALVARGHGGDGGDRPAFRGGNRLPTTCESAKKKRGKGRNLNLIEEFTQNDKTPLHVQFDIIGETYKCVGHSHSMFVRLISNEVEKIPPYYKTWAKVPDSDKDRIFAKLNNFFNIEQHRGTDVWDKIAEGIHRDCASRYRGRKRKVKEHFLDNGGYENVNRAKTHPPVNMDLLVWPKTIDDMYLDTNYRKQSRANHGNKKKQEYVSTHGTSSIAQKRCEEETTNGNGAGLVLGWQKRHMKKNGQWVNQKAKEDFGKILAELEAQRQTADDPSSVDEAMVLRNALGEGRCHNRGVGRKLKCVPRYPQPSQTTNQATSSTTAIAAMEEQMQGMKQVMGMMYYNMQQMQQALGVQNPKFQPPFQFTDPTPSAQYPNCQQMMMQFNEHTRGFNGLRDEETDGDDE